jgi:hypothetical protein
MDTKSDDDDADADGGGDDNDDDGGDDDDDDDDHDHDNNNNNNNMQNATQIQTLSSLTNFSVHIRSSPFIISDWTPIISDLHISLSLCSSSILSVAG